MIIIRNIKYIYIMLKNQFKILVTYKLNFILDVFGNLFYFALQVLFLDVTVGKFGTLDVWNFGTVLMIYGFYQIMMGTYSLVKGDLDVLSENVYNGNFDRYLLRPYSILLQIMMGNLNLSAFFNIAIGSGIFVMGFHILDIRFSCLMLFRIVIAFVLSFSFIVSFYVICSSIAFLLNEKTPIHDMVSVLFQFGQYPTNIYPNLINILITLIIPISFTGFVPILFILNIPYLRFVQVVYPAIAIFFLLLANYLWKKGLKKYESVS